MFQRIIIAVEPEQAASEAEDYDPAAEEAARERFRRTVALMVERAALRYQVRKRRETE